MEILIHKCTLEDKKKFYKPSKIYEGNFDLIFTELYCLTSQEKLVLSGDWNGDVSSGFFLFFEECDSLSEKNCPIKEKKKELFAKTANSLVTIENNEKFMAGEYDHAKVIAGESLMTWRSLSYTQRQ